MKTNQSIVTNTNYTTLRLPQFLTWNMFRMRQSNHILFLWGGRQDSFEPTLKEKSRLSFQ